MPGAIISRKFTKRPSAGSRSAHCPHFKTISRSCTGIRLPPQHSVCSLVLPLSWTWSSNLDFLLSEQLINEGIIMEVEDGILCLSCGKTRKMLSQMRVHLISHGIDNQHPCPFCERVLTSEVHRRTHITRVHKKALSSKQIRALPPFQDQL